MKFFTFLALMGIASGGITQNITFSNNNKDESIFQLNTDQRLGLSVSNANSIHLYDKLEYRVIQKDKYNYEKVVQTGIFLPPKLIGSLDSNLQSNFVVVEKMKGGFVSSDFGLHKIADYGDTVKIRIELMGKIQSGKIISEQDNKISKNYKRETNQDFNNFYIGSRDVLTHRKTTVNNETKKEKLTYDTNFVGSSDYIKIIPGYKNVYIESPEKIKARQLAQQRKKSRQLAIKKQEKRQIIAVSIVSSIILVPILAIGLSM